MRTLALFGLPLAFVALVFWAVRPPSAPTQHDSRGAVVPVGLAPSTDGAAEDERGEYSSLAAELPERVEVAELEVQAAAVEPVDLRGASEALELATARIAELERRAEWLQLELDLCGASVPGGPLGAWLPMLTAEERPSREALVAVAGAMRPYPGVVLSPDEGLWIAQRFELDDWKAYAPTVDEALITFLGPARIAAQVSPERLAELRAEWAAEGLF